MSAICFSLNQSKIVSSVNELNPLVNSSNFSQHKEKRSLKQLWEKRKMLVMSLPCFLPDERCGVDGYEVKRWPSKACYCKVPSLIHGRMVSTLGVFNGPQSL